MVSTCPLISKSSSLFTKPLGFVSSTPLTIGITITFIIHCFLSSLARSNYLFLFLLSFIFTLLSARMAKFTIQQVLFFCWQSLSLVICPRLGNLFVSQNPWYFAHLILQDRLWVLHIPLIYIVKFKFLAFFPVDHLPQSSYTFLC